MEIDVGAPITDSYRLERASLLINEACESLLEEGITWDFIHEIFIKELVYGIDASICEILNNSIIMLEDSDRKIFELAYIEIIKNKLIKCLDEEK